MSRCWPSVIGVGGEAPRWRDVQSLKVLVEKCLTVEMLVAS